MKVSVAPVPAVKLSAPPLPAAESLPPLVRSKVSAPAPPVNESEPAPQTTRRNGINSTLDDIFGRSSRSGTRRTASLHLLQVQSDAAARHPPFGAPSQAR